MNQSARKFDDLYDGDSPLGGLIPWEVGAPQPIVTSPHASGRIGGEVLDAGCGSGEHALFLAARGHAVTGVDFSQVAIAEARAKAAERGVDVAFEVGDALDLDRHENRFDTVVDSMLFHTMDTSHRVRYAAALQRACRTGARVYVMGMSGAARDTALSEFGEVKGLHALISSASPLEPADFAAAFATGWTTESLSRAELLASLPGEDGPVPLPPWLASIRKD